MRVGLEERKYTISGAKKKKHLCTSHSIGYFPNQQAKMHVKRNEEMAKAWTFLYDMIESAAIKDDILRYAPPPL